MGLKRSIKIKKSVDTYLPFCDIDGTHGIKTVKHNTKNEN
jgi:hypothetical protein